MESLQSPDIPCYNRHYRQRPESSPGTSASLHKVHGPLLIHPAPAEPASLVRRLRFFNLEAFFPYIAHPLVIDHQSFATKSMHRRLPTVSVSLPFHAHPNLSRPIFGCLQLPHRNPTPGPARSANWNAAKARATPSASSQPWSCAEYKGSSTARGARPRLSDYFSLISAFSATLPSSLRSTLMGPGLSAVPLSVNSS